jgi:hypothetical protein
MIETVLGHYGYIPPQLFVVQHPTRRPVDRHHPLKSFQVFGLPHKQIMFATITQISEATFRIHYVTRSRQFSDRAQVIKEIWSATERMVAQLRVSNPVSVSLWTLGVCIYVSRKLSLLTANDYEK